MESENTKQLTIVINNLPEELYNDLWKFAAQRAKKQFGGLQLKEKTTIQIDSLIVAHNDYDILVELLSTLMTANVIMEVNDVFDK